MGCGRQPALSWTADLPDEPLFVWLHIFDAHTPYDPPEEYLSRHWPLHRDPFDPRLPEPEDVPPSVFGPGGTYEGLRDLEFPRAKYRAEVDSLDAQLARVLDHPRLGFGVVAITSDHGEQLGHHDVYYDHANVYPDTIHVPLVLSWPGSPEGLRVERAITHLDLGRTLLDLAELTDAPFPGVNLAAPLLGAPEPPEQPRFAIAAHAVSCSISLGPWHLILHTVDNAGHPQPAIRNYQAHQVELFHLQRDPACRTDLVDEEPEVAARLREQLLRWLMSPESTGWAGEANRDEETLRQLAELGYTTTDLGGLPPRLRWESDACEWCRRFE